MNYHLGANLFGCVNSLPLYKAISFPSVFPDPDFFCVLVWLSTSGKVFRFSSHTHKDACLAVAQPLVVVLVALQMGIALW